MADLADMGSKSVDRIDVEAVNAKAKREVYASRVKIFPKRVQGTFRRLKWWIMGVTLAIYYLTPWIRWERGGHAPDQAVLVDLANRRFYFFTIEIWPQEFYYIAGLLIMAGVGLFLVTSTIGRAWCGYFCPQTVWVDLFIWVERLLEGDRNARIKLDQAEWSPSKFTKRMVKFAIWMLISVATGGAWIFYFADAPSLAVNFLTFNAPPIAYTTVAVLTATTFIFGGLMREQVCTYMCPWPRIQAAMLDEDSLTVTYNDWRGEPRSRHLKAQDNAGAGDCIDCNQCVAVCPMGIDIRDGQQLECITCALCIDACDGVMKKIGRPQRLISYATLRDYNANFSGTESHTTWRSFIRPRTLIYTALWSAAGLAMLLVLATRDRLDLNVLHDRNPLFVKLSDGGVRNGYTIKVLNMEGRARRFELALEGLDDATMSLAGSDAGSGRSLVLEVEPDKLRSIRIYVTRPGGDAERTEFAFTLKEIGGKETVSTDAAFHAPER